MSAATVVSFDSSGGIATKNAPLMVQPGSNLILDNCRQERRNEWRTRKGNTHDALDDLPGANVPVLAVVTPTGGFFGLTRQTDAATAGRVYSSSGLPRWKSPSSNGATNQMCSQLTPGLWSRMPIAPTLGPPSAYSVAEGGGLRLTAWWSRVNYALAGNTSIQVSLTALDGTSLNYYAIFGSATSMRPRCVYSSAANVLTIIYSDPVSGNITAARWDCTTGLPVGGGGTVLAANCNATDPFLDAIYYGGATITVAYRDNVGTGNLSTLEFNPATAAITALTASAVDASKCLALLPDPDASGTRYVAVTSAGPAIKVLRLDATGAILSNDAVAAVDAFNIAGTAYQSTTGTPGWMVVYHTFAGGAQLRAVKRRGGVTSAAHDITPAAFTMNHGLASAAWREPGTDAMRFMVYMYGNALNTDQQETFLEMGMEFENGSANISNQWREPQARLLPLNASPTFERAALGQVPRLGADRFLVTLGRLIDNVLIGSAPNAYHENTIDVWHVQYMNGTTYTGQNQGQGVTTSQCAYLPAGSLLQTATGQLPCSHGASALPFEPILTPSTGAGTLTLLALYNYVTTVEMTDEAGNKWESQPSNPVSYKLAGTENTISVAMQLTPFENSTRLRTLKLWRTDANGSAYKLLYSITDSIDNTVAVTFLDTFPDVQLDVGAPLTAELRGTITPAFSHVALWGGRLFGVPRDFPRQVWASEPYFDGVSPVFPSDQAFVSNLDDAHGDITGLVAMDDKLVATKESAIYVAGGDGPGNDGNGPTFNFQIISSETGAIAGTPTLATGSEVYLVSNGGLFRLRRSQEADFVGSAIDLYLSMPLLKSPETVTGLVLSTPENEVRVQTTHYRFVHDRIFNVWMRDTGGFLATPILFTRMLNNRQVFFLASGAMWFEADDSNTPTDAGIAYAGNLRGPWMRPANMEGWIRLRRMRAVGECITAGATAQPTVTIFFDNNDNLSESWQPRASISLVAGPIRADFKPRKELCTSFSPQLTLPAGDATIRFDSWAALVSIEPAMQALPGNDNWGPGAVVATSPCPECPQLRPIVMPVVLTGVLRGNHMDNSSQMVWQWKEYLKTVGWFVVQSYNANSVLPAPGVDSWASFADLNAGGYRHDGFGGDSWIVLGNPNNAMQIMMHVGVTSAPGWLGMDLWMSPGAGFTGGTIGAYPTATDGIQDGNPGYIFGSINPDDYQFYAIAWTAADGSYTRVAWVFAGHVKSFWCIEKLSSSPTGWTKNFMFETWKGFDGDVLDVFARPRATVFQSAYGSSGTFKTVVTPGPDTITPVEGTMEADIHDIVINDQPIANGFSNQYLWTASRGIADRVGGANQKGFWGYVRDEWWVPADAMSLFADFDTMGDNFEFVIIGQRVLRWGLGAIGSGLGLSSPSTNYPSSRWYGRDGSGPPGITA
jgi:hypothetical protein